MEQLDFEDCIHEYVFQQYQQPLMGIIHPLYNNVQVNLRYEQDFVILNPNTLIFIV